MAPVLLVLATSQVARRGQAFHPPQSPWPDVAGYTVTGAITQQVACGSMTTVEMARPGGREHRDLRAGCGTQCYGTNSTPAT
jgi:hypothetical protein